MTEGQELETKNEVDTLEEKEETPEENIEEKVVYKPSDYEYKSWSGRSDIPDGWERCSGYKNVIRRLKPSKLNPDNKSKGTVCQKKASKDGWEPWNQHRGGCCC